MTLTSVSDLPRPASRACVGVLNHRAVKLEVNSICAAGDFRPAQPGGLALSGPLMPSRLL